MNELIYHTSTRKNASKWSKHRGTWADFMKLLASKKTIIQEYTYKQFTRLGTERQSEVKDVGGYVGADLIGGSRKKQAVNERHFLTLDADFAQDCAGFVDACKETLGCAFYAHTTMKHSSAAPRLRLIAPLESPLDSIEYLALARAVADKINMDWFDHTSFQNERLMYWPSCTKDGEFFEYQNDGVYFDGHAFLKYFYGKLNGGYENIENWPYHPNEKKKLNELKDKKQDAAESTDATVRAFCEAYTIEEAIEKFLFDVYERSANNENRYTYINGTSSNGVVIYDKFAYSNHESDPAGGELCNAFDLVRLHRFGNTKDSTPSMREFVLKDKECKRLLIGKTINIGRVYTAEDDFSEFEAEDDDPTIAEIYKEATGKDLDFDDEDLSFEDIFNNAKKHHKKQEKKAVEDNKWLDLLEVDKNGAIVSSEANIKLIVDNDPRIKNVFVKNSITGAKMVRTSAPWVSKCIEECGKNKTYLHWSKEPYAPYSSEEPASVQAWFIEEYKIAGYKKIKEAIDYKFNSSRVNVLAEKLDSLPEWDGVKRVENLLIDCFGADDTEYTKAVASLMLRGAVARAYTPGIKFDSVAYLAGVEGCAKSQFVKELAFNKYYNDSMETFEGQKAYEAVAGFWHMEIPEARALDRSDKNAVKAFLTKNKDNFRGAFRAEVENIPRTCVFWVTTNEFDFLTAGEGNRRFLPVEVHPERFESPLEQTGKIYGYLHENIEQIYAEAKHMYFNVEGGKKLYLPEYINVGANEVRSAYEKEDGRKGIILDYLDGDDEIVFNDDFDFDADARRPKEYTCVMDIYINAFGGKADNRSKYETAFIRDFLKSSKEWKSAGNTTKRFEGLGPQKYYIRV